jgi:hypothetical protein
MLLKQEETGKSQRNAGEPGSALIKTHGERKK